MPLRRCAHGTDPFTTPRPEKGTLRIAPSELEFGPGEGRRTTHYQLEINQRGRVQYCRVTRSSGDEKFDKSVCKQLKKTGRFNRADGKLFQDEARYYNGYYWSSPRGGESAPDDGAEYESAPLLPAEGSATIDMVIGDDGKVTRCEWASEQRPDFDAWEFCKLSDWSQLHAVDGGPFRGPISIQVPEGQAEAILGRKKN